MDKSVRKRRQASRKRVVTKAQENLEDSRIVILGVGESGNGTVKRLADSGVSGAKCLTLDDDFLQIKSSEQETSSCVDELVKNVDVVFVVAALRNQNSASFASVLAERAHRKGAIAVGVVATPFRIEREKMSYAATALNKMRNAFDTVVVIDSDEIKESFPDLSLAEAQKVVDQVSANTIKSLVESITTPGLINLEFDDFRSILQKGGLAMVGLGESNAPNRAEEAVRNAFSSPLLNISHPRATGALINVSGDNHMTIEEVNRVGQFVTERIGQDALVKWGARTSSGDEGFLKVTLVMTGLNSSRILNGAEIMMPGLFDIESSYSEPERQMQVDLGLDQIEDLEE